MPIPIESSSADPLFRLITIANAVTTSSTKLRVRIFRDEIPSIVGDSELSSELGAVLVDVIFGTLYIYEDSPSKRAVDDMILKVISQAVFMKSFAESLVLNMEKQVKFDSRVGSPRLLKWSSLLLSRSQFVSVARNAFPRVAVAQASLLRVVLRGSFRERRACRRLFFRLFSQSLSKVYVEDLRDAKIPFKEGFPLIRLLLEFSRKDSKLFDQWKPIFLDIYVKAVLNARETPAEGLSGAFQPLLSCLSHDDFGAIVVPSALKMLKRNPEIALQSTEVLFKSVALDLSKYAVEILSVVQAQARHANEGRRALALSIIRCLSQKSSTPDATAAMFDAVRAVIGGSEGRLAFPYQRVGMINALQELSSAPSAKPLSNLSSSICSFLMSYYKDEGNEEVKLATLSALASWASQFAAAVQPNLISFLASGLKEEAALRRGHLRCLRAICKNDDGALQISSLVGPLIQLVKTGFTKAVQRLDGIYALMLVAKIAAVDTKAEESVEREKIWSLTSQSEPSLIQVSMAAKLGVEDCLVCVDAINVLLVHHTKRVLDAFQVDRLCQLIFFLVCHPTWAVRKEAYGATKRIIGASNQIAEGVLDEFSNFLSTVADLRLLKASEMENSLESQVTSLPSVE
ncbi:ILITYHIA-like protein, partial [Drosera capensis]